MNPVAIVAGAHDAKFAEQVRSGLRQAGRDASIQHSLPSDPNAAVVLIWSASLETAHTIDAQALIGLWSENRLVVARRDEAPLPLGLRDLPSLDSGKAPADVIAALDITPTRTARRIPIAAWLGGLAFMFLAGGAGWYYFNKDTRGRQAALTAADAGKQAKAEPAKQETVAAVAPKAEVKAPIDPSKMSRSQRERLADEEAARKALVSASKAKSTQRTEVASAAPTATATPGATDPGAPKAATDPDALYEQALTTENGGNAKDAIRIYRRAARAGSGKAAKRLGEIFDRGVEGVPRDYAESLQWYETARQLGETVETAGRRGESPSAMEAAKSAPAPKPTPAPAPSAAPESHTPGWWRFLLIAVLVLAIIRWRRWHKRRKREAEASQSTASPMPAASAAMRAAPAAADAATLFVSYSHKDRARVEPIVLAIEDMGRRVWMDRSDITGKTGWAGQIVRAIRECRAVVLMASPNSYGSDQVVRELYLAMNHKKAIVPIEIEPADMPDELQYILAPFQHHRLSGGETRAVLGRALAAL